MAVRLLVVAPVCATLIGSARPVCAQSLGMLSKAPRSTTLSAPILFLQLPDRADRREPVGLEASLSVGSRIVMFDPTKPDRGVTALSTGFVAVGPPDLSFDGRRILFVGRRSENDSLHVWEMNIDGSDRRQVTDSSGPAVGAGLAVYLSTIYTMDAEEPVYQIVYPDRGGALHTCRMDGSRVRRISFNPHGATGPYLLSDGRLLYSSGLSAPGKSLDVAAGRGTALFTINTDGTDVFPFAGVHEQPSVKGMPCETPDGRVVYVESEPGAAVGGGSLVAVSRTRSLRTKRVVADDPAGFYHSPSAMPDGRLLVSYRSASHGTFGIYLFDPVGGERIAVVFESPDWQNVHARIIQARREPPGRSSVVDDRSTSGLLYCLDAYLSDLPAPDQGTQAAPERIARVQVFGAIAESEDGTKETPAGPKDNDTRRSFTQRLLGEAPVEADGSFFLEVPARLPMRLQTVDRRGNLLHSMRNWMWVMPKESRGCIGCHEDRELTPPNRHVQALRKRAYRIGVPAREDRDR